MKRVLLVLVVILLAVGGGWYFFVREAPQETADPREEILEGEHVYVRLDPLTATVFRDDLPAGSFTASVTLELAGERARDDFKEAESRLRDAMFREIHAMVEREQLTGEAIDLDAVKQRMRAVSLAELGPEVVVEVYVNALLRRGV